MKFIRNLFEEYDAEDFNKQYWKTTVPAVLVLQIAFWFVGWKFYVRDLVGKVSVIEAILQGIYWGFGGILLYYFCSVIVMIFAAVLNQKPALFISFIFGIIGSVLIILGLIL